MQLKILKIHPKAQHCEVVVGLGAVAVGFNLGVERLYYLLGAVEAGVLQNAEKMVLAKLILLSVFGLGESIGIYKEGTILDVRNLLAFVLQIGPQTDWGISLHLKELAMG